jgi:nifR3 family TIM-barrel protein
MRLGSLDLDSNLFLSPLAGYTNLPFRLVIREIGGVGLCTTDLVNARSLIERNPKALKLIESHEREKPMAIQLFGAVPEEMVAAAQYCESVGADSVDINMGCPVPKVVKIGGGSAMMNDYEGTASLVRRMVNAVKIPVTCKMRLGWDENSLTAPDLARALEDAGAAAIFVHGRTRQQGFEGKVNLAGIRAVVQAVKHLPVIGNGDVTTPQAAKKMLEFTGCAGVSVGRGAFYNPWIFRHIREFLQTGVMPEEPSFDERVRVMSRHLDLMIEVFGEAQGCLMFRKVGPWYAKRFGPANFFNKRIVRLSTRTEFGQLLDDYRTWRAPFLEADGSLQVRFAPGEMGENFSEGFEETPVVTQRNTVPVPSGPVELW